jgi:hypothetical protein
MRYGIARKLARSERARFLAEELDRETATDMIGAERAPFRLVPLKEDRRFGVEWQVTGGQPEAMGYTWKRTT